LSKGFQQLTSACVCTSIATRFAWSMVVSGFGGFLG
jgi:hypothetical protein